MAGLTDTFDFVIVGGGSAGAVLARRIADAEPGYTVCLIEAGPAFEHDPRVLRLLESLALVGDPAYDYDYPIVPQQRGNSHVRISRARMLGGCSSHNDAWALRAPDADMDRWQALGADGWDATGTRPYFDRVFAEMQVHPVPRESALSHAWVAAAAACGYSTIDTTSGVFGDGIGWVSLNERDGVRVSTAVAYLYPLSDLPANLTLRLETRVTRILIERGRARAVETDRGVIHANREVVISAGAIDTPKLLMLSGLGPADHLRTHGIDVEADLAGVGANLSDHIETPVIWATSREPGPSLNGLDLGMYAALGGEAEVNVQATIGHFTYWLDAEPFTELPRPARAFCFAPNVARPASRGTVRLASADPSVKPLIDPGYFTDPDGRDERLLVEGVRLARRVAASEGLVDWIDQEVAPGPAIRSDADLGAYARRYSNTVYHPSATCRMGASDDPGAVVDHRLRVRGLDGLRIADASVFPELVRVNPNMTVVMVGAKAADLILDDHRGAA